MPTNPYLRFFPDSWMNDAGLRRCSRSTRATWMDLLCLAHQGTPYGHLADANGGLPIKFMAQWCNMTSAQLIKSIQELQKFNVFSRNERQIIYCRRMVRDEEVRGKRAIGGGRSAENNNVPRRKGYPLPTNGSGEVKDTPIAIDIASGVVVLSSKSTEISRAETRSMTFEATRSEAWLWLVEGYPGEVNPDWDCQMFMSVIQGFEDIADLKRNLPLWKVSPKWAEGFVEKLENFLRKRMFKNPPKAREPTLRGASVQDKVKALAMERIARDGHL